MARQTVDVAVIIPDASPILTLARDEYATQLSRTASPNFVPLVLFEDPDVLETRIARLPRVHLLNTAAWIMALADEGVIADGVALMETINARRKFSRNG